MVEMLALTEDLRRMVLRSDKQPWPVSPLTGSNSCSLYFCSSFLTQSFETLHLEAGLPVAFVRNLNLDHFDSGVVARLSSSPQFLISLLCLNHW